MRKVGTEHLQYPASKPVFPELFKELMDNAARWADAEFALAKAEASVLLRSYATGLLVALFSFVALITATVILAQAGVIALAAYFDSQVLAGVVIGLILLGAVVLLAFIARHLLMRKTPAKGLIFRWLAGDAAERVPK